MQVDGFDWDDGNFSKCQKHGVSIPEIESLFFGVPMIGPDIAHSKAEQRFRAVGRTESGRHLFIVFTLRRIGEGVLIRPLSARYMHKKEVDSYEKEVPGF